MIPIPAGSSSRRFDKSASGARPAASSAPAVHGTTRATRSLHPRTGDIAEKSATGAPLEPAFVDQVTASLAVRIGPIARILTKKAAQQASSRGEFVRLVAGNLEMQERAAFLRDIGYTEI